MVAAPIAACPGVATASGPNGENYTHAGITIWNAAGRI
jgi:hypothetical protein